MIRSRALHERAVRVLPGGVSSPVRAFKAVGGSPRYIQRARGCHLIDVDGAVLIDYIGSWGAAILGHAHPAVVEAVSRAIADGSSFGACAPGEVQLAEAIGQRVPSAESVRFTNSGTEAVMTALRLARAVTQRDLVIKFDGCYHGHADAMLVRSGSGAATLGLSASPGVGRAAARATAVLPYNDLDAVDRFMARRGSDMAAIIVEPVAGNMGVVPPAPGFLQGLHETTRRHGALLIFDEVMTGFRIARGGAQERYRVRPDLTTFGKIIGGGLPVGAVAGPRRIMDMLAPAGPVYQAGTFSGNPLTMAAGLATLEQLNARAYEWLEHASEQLEQGLRAALPGAVVQRVGSMLSVFFAGRPVTGMETARRADHDAFAAFFRAMLASNVHLPPSGYEAWFVSLAHDELTIEATIHAAREAGRTASHIHPSELAPGPHLRGANGRVSGLDRDERPTQPVLHRRSNT